MAELFSSLDTINHNILLYLHYLAEIWGLESHVAVVLVLLGQIFPEGES